LREFFKFVSFVDFPIPMNEIIIIYKNWGVREYGYKIYSGKD
jgi:hypothetical protein